MKTFTDSASRDSHLNISEDLPLDQIHRVLSMADHIFIVAISDDVVLSLGSMHLIVYLLG
jgi:hypothetical protein